MELIPNGLRNKVDLPGSTSGHSTLGLRRCAMSTRPASKEDIWTVFKEYRYTFIFFAMFSKGENFHDFLFAYLGDEVFPKEVYS